MGMAFKAIGQNMEAAKVSGVKPVKYRLINFVVSCAFAGWFGGFYAHYYKILTPDLLHTTKTIEILVIAYIGGRGSLWGGLFAAIPFVFAMENIRSTLSDIPGMNLIIYSLFLVLIMIFYPGGFYHFYKENIENSKNKFLKFLTSSSLSTLYSKFSKVSG
jgi:branched-chain amino acid transport system permease protein